MKKIVSVLVILAIFSTSIFALSATDADSPTGEIEQEVELFSIVQETPLTDLEMETVEGEGVAGAIIGAGIGYVVGGVIGYISGGPSVGRTYANYGVALGVSVGLMVGP